MREMDALIPMKWDVRLRKAFCDCQVKRISQGKPAKESNLPMETSRSRKKKSTEILGVAVSESSKKRKPSFI